MNARRKVGSWSIVEGLLLCIGCCITMSGAAQQPAHTFWGDLEFGVGAVSEDSFKFGEYSGLQNSGAFALGNIDIASAFAFDGDSADYWSLSGSNLGLESRSVEAELGRQGTFAAFFHFHQLPQYRFDNASTPFLAAGTADQSLPNNWVASNTTGGLTNLFATLSRHKIKTEREQFGGGLSWLFAKGWEVSGNYRHETKDGQDTIAAIFGTNGGNPRGAILVAPVDYDMDSADVSIAYTGKLSQFSVAYHLSLFNNRNKSLTWDNPFLRLPFGNTWAPGTDFTAGARGQLALAPDNQAHRISFAGGHRIGATTRLTANVSYGWMKQNERFLPYTTNPNLAALPNLPRADLDGRIETTFVNLGVSTRPTRKLSLRANYVYDKQDNETPRDIYRIVVNDSGNQGALLSSNARVNTPYSFSTHRFTMDAGYRLRPTTKLTFGYKFEQRDRDFTEVASTDEHTGQVKLWSSLSTNVSGWVEYVHAERDGSSYISNRPFLSAHNPAYIATLAPEAQFINDPLLRKYNYADRDRDSISATINVIPFNTLTFSVNGRYGHDDYEESPLGLQNRKDGSVTIDAAYTPNKLLTSYAFFTHERLIYEQDGYQRAALALFPGFVRAPPPCATCGFWNVETDDEINTVGVGTTWTAIKDKLEFKFDYTYSRSVTDTIPNADPTVDFAGLPAITSSLHNFDLTGEYQAARDLAIRLRYRYGHLDIDDFANDTRPDTLRNIIGLGGVRLDYDAHVVGLSFVYTFR